MEPRHGVTPILSFILLISIIIVTAGSAVIFLQGTQSDVLEDLQLEDFETVNMSCGTGQITWWIDNQGEQNVPDPDATLIIVHGERLNRTVPLELSGGFLQAGGTGAMQHTPTPPLELGERYQLRLEFGNIQLQSTCRAGGTWWNINWDYRRPVTIPNSNPPQVDATLNSSRLVQEGKLRSDCADIRIGQGDSFRAYDIDNGECGSGNMSVIIDTADLSPQIYVYYGNLQAGSNESSLGGSAPLAQLGPEERIRLPQ